MHLHAWLSPRIYFPIFIPITWWWWCTLSHQINCIPSPHIFLLIPVLLHPCNFQPYFLMFGIFSSTVKVHRGRELTGAQRFSSINPVSNYEHMRLHRRILGHLSAVYCIAFDRTGLRIFTVRWNLSTYRTTREETAIQCAMMTVFLTLPLLFWNTDLHSGENAELLILHIYEFDPQLTVTGHTWCYDQIQVMSWGSPQVLATISLMFSNISSSRNWYFSLSGLRWLSGEDLVFLWWKASFDTARTLCRDHGPGG